MIERREISISTDTFIRAALVIAGAILVFLIRDVLLALLVAVVIAAIVSPAVEFFVKFRLPRALAAGIVFGSSFAALIGFFYFFAPIIVSEVSNFLETVPDYSHEIDVLDPEVGRAIVSLEEIIANVRASLGTLYQSAFAVVGVVFGGLFSFVLIVAIAFYISIQERGIARFISYVVPAHQADYALGLWERSQRKISQWFKAMTITALSVGIAVYLGLLALGVPHAFFFALLSAILNFIPIVGPLLAAIPAAVTGFVDGGLLIGLLTIALFVFIHSLEGNVIYPLIAGKVIGVSPIVIIAAIAIGSTLGGFLGFILAIPASVLALEFFNDIRERRKREESPPEGERLAES